ncbi:MAG TPA: GTP 3',8-cyclase MoaA [Sphingorhabdus sp.]|jgi:cyclic pyranopterin phosphate synthase|nr:GTP 3',8-cyclase MoaA [Sphingorhabdus sp.]
MIDGFGRKIDYLRISVTDRCNFRCHYCMPEKQQFLPHRDLLDYTEIALLANRFIAHGIRKIRLTGGEPLVRRDIEVLIRELGGHVKAGRLDELTLTTNGSRLAPFAPILAETGVRRINVSIDSLDRDKFREITHGGDLAQVLDGIATAKSAGIAIKINMVALKGDNEAALLPIAEYCATNGFDLSIIETMPLGDSVFGRQDHYVALEEFIAPLRDQYELHASTHRSSGPARYWQVEPLSLRLGLITPMSHNFCEDCNRIRLTTDGKVFMCLGSEMHVDFRKALRNEGMEAVDRLLQKALRLKPERHDFERQMAEPGRRLHRHMNATGG